LAKLKTLLKINDMILRALKQIIVTTFGLIISIKVQKLKDCRFSGWIIGIKDSKD
jgi:hypothetical protein